MCGEIRVGTSGWSYPLLADSFYRDVPRRAWLAHYASRFDAVEINASYYRLQSESTFARWREQTPEGFRFSVKANRHLVRRRLAEPAHSIALERERATVLGDKLAAVLWQLPPAFEVDLEALRRFAAALAGWRDVAHVIEFRHLSWFTRDVHACLRDFGLANCISDAADWPCWELVTAGVAYVRLHGHERTYSSGYRAPALRRWAERVRCWSGDGHAVHAYFDNTAHGLAVRDAHRLRRLLGQEPARR